MSSMWEEITCEQFLDKMKEASEWALLNNLVSGVLELCARDASGEVFVYTSPNKVGMTYPDWITFLLMVDKLALHPDVEPNRRPYLYNKSPW